MFDPPYCCSGLANSPDEQDDERSSRLVHTDPRIAAVHDPGHFGAAMLFGPTVCFRCSATHTTHTPVSFVSLCKKTVVPAYTTRGHWPSCALLVMGRPMTERRFSLVLFVTSAVHQGLS